MSETLLVALIAAGATIVSAIAALLAVWVDRRAKHRTAEAAAIAAQASDKAAEAATTAAEAAAEEARAQMRQAIVSEREQASADWARYTEAMQKWNERLEGQIGKTAQEIEHAKLRILEAEQRAYDWEKLYRKASIYLRGLILWINEHLPGESYPVPPPELDLDL